MDILAKLFSSGALPKIMRLFLFHPLEQYDIDGVVSGAKVPRKSALYETKLLTDVGFLKERMITKSVSVKRRGQEKVMKRRVKGYVLNEKFPYLIPLRMLLVNTDLMNQGEIRKRLQKTGRIKFIATSGIFLQDPDGRLDLFVVGEGLKREALTAAVRSIESIIGAELRYASFTPREFEYRLNIGDRLVRDMFDYPHIVVLNRFSNLDLTPQANGGRV